MEKLFDYAHILRFHCPKGKEIASYKKSWLVYKKL